MRITGRNIRLAALVAVAIAIAVLAVVQPWRGSPPAPITPPISGLPTASASGTSGQALVQPVNKAELNGLHLPGAAAAPQPFPSNCKPQPEGSASGIWIPDWADNPAQSVLTPAQSKLGLVDLAWLGLGDSPSSIQEAAGINGARSLSDALTSVAQTNPCTWRFVTVQDATSTAQMQMMAQILTNPTARRQLVLALADEMASHPLAQGLTLDFEFSLPSTQSDLNLYASAGKHLSAADPATEVNQLTVGYDQLVWDLARAMHMQHRWLRVAVKVRVDGDLDEALAGGNVSPYLMDYDTFAAYANQILVMAYDLHWAEGNPGPIAPLAGAEGVSQIMDYVMSQDVPVNKVALCAPLYAYDWTVGSNNQKLAGSPAAAQYTPSTIASKVATGRWHLAGTVDQETEYTYQADGHTHVVWNSATGLHYEAQHFPQYPIMVWEWSNMDPVGAKIVAQALRT